MLLRRISPAEKGPPAGFEPASPVLHHGTLLSGRIALVGIHSRLRHGGLLFGITSGKRGQPENVHHKLEIRVQGDSLEIER